MERIANTLLPARMFVLCTDVCFGNGIVGSSYFDEILKQVQNDVLKAQWQKGSAFFKLLQCGIGSCIFSYFLTEYLYNDEILNQVQNDVLL